METLRDAAFGKVVRIFTGRRLLSYPEEINSSVCGEYLHDHTKPEEIEAATSTETEEENEEDPNFGLYALMPQVSRSSRSARSARSRRTSSASTVRDPVVVGWRGPYDSEVRLLQRLVECGLTLIMDI